MHNIDLSTQHVIPQYIIDYPGVFFDLGFEHCRGIKSRQIIISVGKTGGFHKSPLDIYCHSRDKKGGRRPPNRLS